MSDSNRLDEVEGRAPREQRSGREGAGAFVDENTCGAASVRAGGSANAPAPRERTLRGRNAAVLLVVVIAWVAADLATKAYFNQFSTGQAIAGPFLGLFQFKLVHNTGMAWGMLSDSTFLLGVMSLVVCVALAVYLFVFASRASMVQVLGVSLVVAGGIGNAVDRFTQGYVVDFIDLAFMDFPVFNVADIGVTCGFILFLLALLIEWRREDAQAASANVQVGASDQEPRAGVQMDASANDQARANVQANVDDGVGANDQASADDQEPRG